jgi:hypothetical protein
MPEIMHTELSVQNKKRQVLSSVFSFLGELLEYKDKMTNNGKLKDVQQVNQLFSKAINLYPYEGKYYMLIASNKN